MAAIGFAISLIAHLALQSWVQGWPSSHAATSFAETYGSSAGPDLHCAGTREDRIDATYTSEGRVARSPRYIRIRRPSRLLSPYTSAFTLRSSRNGQQYENRAHFLRCL